MLFQIVTLIIRYSLIVKTFCKGYLETSMVGKYLLVHIKKSPVKYNIRVLTSTCQT